MMHSIMYRATVRGTSRARTVRRGGYRAFLGKPPGKIGGTWAWLMVLFLLGSRGQAQVPSCGLYLKRLGGLIEQEERISWRSALLSPAPLGTLSPAEIRVRVAEIATAVWDPNSPLGKEVEGNLNQYRGTAEWLRDYFLSYEVFYWSPRYQEIVELMHRETPVGARVLDLGSGTGGLGGQLAERSSERTVVFLDHESAMREARRRAVGLFPSSPQRFDFLPMYLGPYSHLPEKPSFDTVLMNHVLYVMFPKAKLAAVRAVREALRPGGKFLVNEPLREVALQGERHREWLIDTLSEALIAGAPHTEAEITTILAFASGRATRGLRQGRNLVTPFLTQEEHENLFRDNGFEILHSATTYQGFSRFWVLERM